MSHEGEPQAALDKKEGSTEMKIIRSFLPGAKGLFVKYPAILSGSFLYGYLFISIIRLFIKAKGGIVPLEGLYDIFGSLLILWLLALSCVKILEEHSKLHQTEEELAREQGRRLSEEAHVATMMQVERTLQHKINTPLTVIALSIARLKRAAQLDRELLGETVDIDDAWKQIGTVLTDFSKARAQ
jgi:hypothetical protein